VSVSRVPLGIHARPLASGLVQSTSYVRPIPSIARRWGIRLIALTIITWLASLALGFHAGLILLTVLGFAAAVAGLGKPTLGVFGVVVLCTLDPLTRLYLLTGGLLRHNLFNYWLVVVMALHFGWLLRLRDPQIRLLQVFIALLTVELVFSTDLTGGAQHVLNIAAVFGLLIYFARASRDREVWYWSAMVSGVLSGLGSLSFYLQQDSLPTINANAWSFFPLTSLFAACVYFASPGRRRRSRLLVSLVSVNAGWVFLSGSRGSMLIGVVCLLFILARLRQVQGGALTLVAAALFVIALAGQFVGQESEAVSRLAKLFDSERSMTNRTSGRWDLALGGWRIFLDEPLGVGTGGFPEAWATLQNRREISAFEGASKQAHSGWIKILAENGVPGILLFTAFVLSFAVLGWRRRNAGMFLPGLLVTLVLSVAFLAEEFQGKGLWYLVGAIILFARLSSGVEVRPRAFQRVGSFLGAPPSPAR
jgi:O-antigen ligase